MKKRYYNDNSLGAFSKLGIGAGISLLSVLSFSILFGIIAMLFNNITGVIPLFSMLTVILSAALSGVIVSRMITNGNLGLSVLSFLLSWLILMLIGVIINKGSLPLSVFLNLVIFVGISTLCSYVFKKRDINIKRRFKR